MQHGLKIRISVAENGWLLEWRDDLGEWHMEVYTNTTDLETRLMKEIGGK